MSILSVQIYIMTDFSLSLFWLTTHFMSLSCNSTLSMCEEVDQLRMTVNKKKVLAWREECKKCEKQK